MLPADVRTVLEATVNLPLPERIDAISAALLGRPYVADPLGEGAANDLEPLVRYDTFDCLTYVEEVLALSMSSDPSSAGPVRTSLRYDGETAYANRHHFMELQWIPEALREGWLRDTTAEYGPVTVMQKQVDAATWSSWAGRKGFALTDEQLPVGPMRLEVLDLDTAIAAAPRIRPSTVVLTVRADRGWKPIWISHVGIVVPGATPTVRHATKMGAGSTRDHGLVWYLEHLKTYDKWPAVGVSLLEPVPYGPRLARLSAEQREQWAKRDVGITTEQ